MTSTGQARVRVEAVDLAGNVGSATSAAFTLDNSPNAPSSPSPSIGATDVPTDTILSWACSDPNGDALTYDIYFGTHATPPKVESGWSVTSYDPGPLEAKATYYWRVVVSDGFLSTEGDLWHFETAAAPELQRVHLPVVLKQVP